MSIKYWPSKKSVFEGYIDKAVNKLKSAESETTGVLKCEFPSKTIIGRRFNKRATISTLARQINSAYTSLSKTKNNVHNQIIRYLTTDKLIKGKALSMNQILILNLMKGKYNDNSERELEEVKKIIEEYGDDDDKLLEVLRKNGYDEENIHGLCNYLYQYYRHYRYQDKNPKEKEKAWNNYDILNKLLTMYSGVFKSEELREVEDIDLKYIAFMENNFKDSSQSQGAAWLGKNKIAICDIDGATDEGVIRIIEIDPNDPGNIKEISRIPVTSHSNDIEYISDKNAIIHPNSTTGQIEVIYLDKNFQLDNNKNPLLMDEKGNTYIEPEIIRTQNANGISYDKKTKEITLVEDIYVESYSYDNFFDGGKSSSKCLIPDSIKDEKNGIYYNLRGGATEKDGKLYVCYTGYEEDKRSYHGDTPQGTMTVIYDIKTGKCLKRVTNTTKAEVESIAINDEGKQIWIMNNDNDTDIYESDTSKIEGFMQANTNNKKAHTTKTKKKK